MEYLLMGEKAKGPVLKDYQYGFRRGYKQGQKDLLDNAILFAKKNKTLPLLETDNK